jgi:hypothetical protein
LQKNAGSISAGTTVTIRVTSAATTNYNAASATYTLTINKASISPTVSMSGYTYGGTKSTPSITGNTGNGTVTYYYNTSNSNSGGTAWTQVTNSTYLNAGTYYMYATVAATTNYNSVTTATKSFTISKANGYVNLSATSGTTTYGTASKTFTVSSHHGGTLSVAERKSTAAGERVSGRVVTIAMAIRKTTTTQITISRSKIKTTL